MPGSHKPLLIQKLLAKPYIGYFISLFTNRMAFHRNFKRIFGVVPSTSDLDEFWLILNVNNGFFFIYYYIIFIIIFVYF